MKRNKVEETKSSKKKQLNKAEKTIDFLDQNRKIIYGFIGGILVTAIVATIIWPDRIATLKDGTQPVAEINGEKITADTLYEDMKDYYSISLLLERIDDTILSKMYEETDEMNEEIEQTAQDYYNQGTAYEMTEEQVLSQLGFSSHKDFIEALRLNYLRNKYFEEYVESIITDKEIEEYYDDKVFGDIDSKHMLVAIDDDRNDEEALNLAKEIISKLNEGKSFDEVKEEYKDSITYEELGYLAFNASIEENYMNAIEDLKNNEYTSEPVKTSYGYHIIYRIDQKEKSSLEDIKDIIIDEISKEKQSEDSNLYSKALKNLREEKELSFYDTVMEDKYKDYLKSIEE